MPAEPVETFAALFRGRTDAIGINKGGVERITVNRAHYKLHLKGVNPIGIFPMLDDNTVWFAAIDLDEPDFELARKLQTLIPGASWLERSRSGNAHVWVFFERPAPAWAVRAVLRGATQAVGRPEVEVFPKQDQLKEGMVGNYINLPLFGDERPLLQGHPPYEPLPAAKALPHMHAHRQDPEAWERRARALGAVPPEARERQAEWGTQPTLHMCGEYIIKNRHRHRLRDGVRHTVLFNLAKMLLNWRECTDDEALTWLGWVNDASGRPLPRRELERTFENAQRGQFTSTGCDDPQMVGYTHPDCPIANG